MSNSKKALIIEGGGSRGVFSFGVIDSFIKASYKPFDIHLGVSNGAVVQLWYLLATADYNLDKMLFSASKDYVSFKNIFLNKSIMNFTKLYEDANKVFPIDFDRLTSHLANKNFYVVVSDAQSGEAEYIELDRDNYVNQLLATGSLPILMREPILLDGLRKYDGGITDPLPVQKAYELGAREIVIIRTYEKEFVRQNKLENYIAAWFTNSYPRISVALKQNAEVYNQALDFIRNPPTDCTIIEICPPARLTAKRTTTDPVIMKANYKIGLKVGQDYLNQIF